MMALEEKFLQNTHSHSKRFVESKYQQYSQKKVLMWHPLDMS